MKVLVCAHGDMRVALTPALPVEADFITGWRLVLQVAGGTPFSISTLRRVGWPSSSTLSEPRGSRWCHRRSRAQFARHPLAHAALKAETPLRLSPLPGHGRRLHATECPASGPEHHGHFAGRSGDGVEHRHRFPRGLLAKCSASSRAERNPAPRARRRRRGRAAARRLHPRQRGNADTPRLASTVSTPSLVATSFAQVVGVVAAPERCGS